MKTSPDEDDEDYECEIKPDGTKVCRKKIEGGGEIHLGKVKNISCRENPRTGTWECSARTSSKKVPHV